MILVLSSFLRALGQMGSMAFLRVILLGAGLALILLGLMTWAMGQVIFAFVPETMTLPFIGDVGGIGVLLSWGGIALMMTLSVFLMIPVASLFSGMFLDTIASAVEIRHYPNLPPAKSLGFYEGIRSSINFLGVVIAVNALALIFYALSGPFAPITFWLVNGYLLGREYFSMIAQRSITDQSAKAMRRKHWAVIWLAGICMAIPLSIPILNLLIPVLGVATYTHIFHTLRANSAADLP